MSCSLFKARRSVDGLPRDGENPMSFIQRVATHITPAARRPNPRGFRHATEEVLMARSLAPHGARRRVRAARETGEGRQARESREGREATRVPDVRGDREGL